MSTYGKMQTLGYTQTEDEIKAIERLIMEQYDAAYKEIDARLAKLYAQYQSGKVGDQGLYDWLIMYDRNIKLQNDIKSIYKSHAKDVSRLQLEASKLGMTNNYYRQMYSLTWAQPELSFSILNPALVDVAVAGQLKSWTEMSKVLQARYNNVTTWAPATNTLGELLVAENFNDIKKIQRSINSGLIAGDSYSKISRNVKDVFGEVSKKEMSGLKANALRITRTEGNRALNAGNYANTLDAAAQGIEMLRMWDATLDIRTRSAHSGMDGKTTAVDKPFVFPQGWTAWYPGAVHTGNSKLDAGQNINCRCTVVDLPDGVKPELRRGRNPVTGESEVFTYKDFTAWAKKNGLAYNKAGRLVVK